MKQNEIVFQTFMLDRTGIENISFHAFADDPSSEMFLIPNEKETKFQLKTNFFDKKKVNPLLSCKIYIKPSVLEIYQSKERMREYLKRSKSKPCNHANCIEPTIDETMPPISEGF